jgi:hypothetical protein
MPPKRLRPVSTASVPRSPHRWPGELSRAALALVLAQAQARGW